MAAVSRWFNAYGYAEVYDGLVIGAVPLDREDVGMLEWIGVRRILNLVEDEEYGEGIRDEIESALDELAIQEHRIALVDFGGLAPEALEEAVGTINGWLDEAQTVYVHCRAGWQRSAAVAAGVIATREGIPIDSAVSLVRARKPTANPLPHQRDDLRRWWLNRRPSAERL